MHNAALRPTQHCLEQMGLDAVWDISYRRPHLATHKPPCAQVRRRRAFYKSTMHYLVSVLSPIFALIAPRYQREPHTHLARSRRALDALRFAPARPRIEATDTPCRCDDSRSAGLTWLVYRSSSARQHPRRQHAGRDYITHPPAPHLGICFSHLRGSEPMESSPTT